MKGDKIDLLFSDLIYIIFVPALWNLEQEKEYLRPQKNVHFVEPVDDHPNCNKDFDTNFLLRS
jgi:hypothetical protein